MIVVEQKIGASRPPHLYLIDGSGFIFRAFHAVPILTRSDGIPVNAVYGFTNMLLKILDYADVDYFCVVFDSSRRNFRHEIYSLYKANRAEPPEELIPQFSIIRDVCRAFNVPMLEEEGFEADDLIATYVKEARRQGIDVTIVSSDKDLMQLIQDGVVMFDPMKEKIISMPEVIEKFGVPAEKVIDVQALAGDSVDNIPGVPGIGIKTAAELINTFGDLETLLAQASTIRQPKRRQSLMDFADEARVSKQLVSLKSDVFLSKQIEELRKNPFDVQDVLRFLKKQEFHSLIKRFENLSRIHSGPHGQGQNVPVVPQDYTLVQSVDVLKTWVQEAFDKGCVAIDTETTSLDAMEADLVGISLSLQKGVACYIPIHHQVHAQELNFTGSHHTIPKQIPLADVVSVLKPLLWDESVLKISHNFKYDAIILARHGLVMNGYDDTMVLSYVLDGGRHGHSLDELSKLYLEHNPITYESVTGTGKNQITFDYVPLKEACAYAAEDADMTFQLHKLLKQRLKEEKQIALYEKIDRPLVSVLQRMEMAGVKVDALYLQHLSRRFQSSLEKIEADIYAYVGQSFNLASPKQLGEIMFDQLKLPGGKKNKLGAYGTDVDVLEELVGQGHSFAEWVLNWRQLAKLKSTYTEALQKQINGKTGRIHTSYAQTLTLTGRLSSSYPNLQNIPIRTEDGREIRRAFIAEKGCKLLSLDYSQIELRLLAHVAQIEALKHAFYHKQDIHTRTASEIFNVPYEKVDPFLRRQAKAINFGIIYGMSAFGLARQLRISKEEASRYIKLYYEKYPGIQAYMNQMKEIARQQGYVETLFKRRCFIKGIHDQKPVVRGFAERQAINAPLQGTAADLIKLAMCQMQQALDEHHLKAKMILQVHDELIFEVPEEEVEKTLGVAKKIMEHVIQLDVPLVVDCGVGESWAEAH